MAHPNAIADKTDDAELDAKLRTDDLRGGNYDRPSKKQIAAYKRAQAAMSRMATENATANPTQEKAVSTPERPDDIIRGLGGEVLYIIDIEGDIILDDRSDIAVDDEGYTVPFVDPEELAAEHAYLPKAS